MTKRYKWTDYYMEFANILLNYKNDRGTLIEKIQKVYKQIEMKLPRLEKNGIPKDIDPFTVFGLFNKGITDANRVKILEGMSKEFNIKAEVPNDFSGIPVLNNMMATFYAFEDTRGDSDIDNLWNVFNAAILFSEKDTDSNRELFSNAYDLALTQYAIKSQNYYANNFSEIWDDISDVINFWYDAGWITSNEYTSLKSCYEAEEMEYYTGGPEYWINDWGVLGWVDYLEEYGMEVTVTFNGEDSTINLADESEIWYEIVKSGEFEVTAFASNGSIGTTTINIDKFLFLNYSNYDYYGYAQTLELYAFGDEVDVLAEYQPKMRYPGVDHDIDLIPYIYKPQSYPSYINIVDALLREGLSPDPTQTTVWLNVGEEVVEWTGLVGSSD